MSRRIFAFAPICLMIMIGCGSKDGQLSQDSGKKPGLTKLQINDMKVGQGAPVEKGDSVYVGYRGTLMSGAEFDSNLNENAMPFMFRVGGGEVVRGWDEGFVGMKIGGERELLVPAEMGYGVQGNGEKIPPNSDLKFKVILYDVVKPGEESAFWTEDIVEGKGPAVKAGDTVTVDYEGTLVNGHKFDSTKDRMAPLVIRLTKEEVGIPGWIDGLTGMKVGGRRKIRLGPNVGLGFQSKNGVPPNSVLMFDVKLLKIEK